MTKQEMDIKKRVLLALYENSVHAILKDKKALELPDYILQDLKKLRNKTEEIRQMEKLGD